MSVSRAVKVGRLRECVVRDPAGKLLGISDLETAAREWLANSDYTDTPQHSTNEKIHALLASNPVAAAPEADESVPAETDEARGDVSGPATMSEASLADKFWRAKLSELKYREHIGELVPASEVKREWANILTACRTRLLAIPSRVKQSIPHLTLAEIDSIEALIREALEDLVSGE